MRPIRSSRLRKRILLSVFLLFPCALKARVEPQTTVELAESQESDVPTLILTFEEIIGQVGQEISLPLKITSSTPIKEPFQIILRFPPSKLKSPNWVSVKGPARQVGSSSRS